jgi:filamentous hemagglutinin family protein
MLTDRSRKARTLCSSLAIATALLAGASAAQAQSFQGNGTFNSGSGTINTAPNDTTITINSTDAVIDWTTFDTATGGGSIDFQPAGTTATFTSFADFSVLNRIMPTDASRAIQFNGTVIAQIQQTTTNPGGTVYFYSPGGIIIGSTAVFNVGNLGLTSISPEVVGGVFEQGSGSEFVKFNGAVTAGSAVKIEAGAQITGTAPGGGSYLAVVAPRIDNAGAISGKRVSAFVSADAATITFNPNGLFDIQVTSGTSFTGPEAALFSDGSITGPAGDAGAASRIYMVAVPKNTAITMAIGAGQHARLRHRRRR